MAEDNCVGCENIRKYVALKCDAFAAIEASNVQFQLLKIILIGRNVQKLLCVLDAMKRNILQLEN